MFFALIVFFALEETIVAKIAFTGIKPDIILSLVAFFAYYFGNPAGFEAGLFAGIVKDALNISYFGTNTIFFVLFGWFAGFLSDKVYRENFVTQFLTVLLASLIISRLHVGHAFYSALLAPFVFFVMRKIYNITEDSR